MTQSISFAAVLFLFFVNIPVAKAIFLDGDGHYAARGVLQTNPEASSRRGLLQGTQHSFRLMGEARANDKLSMNLEFRLLPDPSDGYWGDTVQPEDCSDPKKDGRGSSRDCQGRHQDTSHPGYAPYVPQITEAFVRYGFEYCLLELGRRGRDWGLGIFLDSGKDPFETSYSVFDGVSCSVNIQKAQALGFTVGFDKLAETGASVDNNIPKALDSGGYGPTKRSDDLSQMYFVIEYDDRKASNNSSFNRQIGIYIANIFGKETLGGGMDGSADVEARDVVTDLKFADLFTGFYFPRVSLRSEILFRLGKSGDPSWARYGGVSNNVYDSPVNNNLDSIGMAGDIDFVLSRSGAYVGPKEFNQGIATSHHLFLEYAYAPGDRDGYYPEYEGEGKDKVRVRSKENRKPKTTAMAFHRNYKPALIFFNGGKQADDLRVDGNFDPNRVMNATVLSTGYRYESTTNGNFTFKLIYAALNTTIPQDVKDTQAEAEAEAKASDDGYAPRRPIGFSGKNLGWELDLRYSKAIGRDIELGADGGIAVPGNAWRTSRSDSPELSYLIQVSAAFKF